MDDAIPAQCQVRWAKWVSELPLLEQFKVNRYVKPAEFGTVVSQQIPFSRMPAQMDTALLPTYDCKITKIVSTVHSLWVKLQLSLLQHRVRS